MTSKEFNALDQIERKKHLATAEAGVQEDVLKVGNTSFNSVYKPTIGGVPVIHEGREQFPTHPEALQAAREEKKRYYRICINQGYIKEKSPITNH